MDLLEELVVRVEFALLGRKLLGLSVDSGSDFGSASGSGPGERCQFSSSTGRAPVPLTDFESSPVAALYDN